MTRKALTIVELTVALAIAGMLLAATLRVTSSLTRRGDWVKRRGESVGLREDIERVLAGDVVNADRCRNIEDGLVLETRACLDGEALELIHLPCHVRYQVREAGGTHWLIRTQQSLDGKTHSDLVSPAVTGISLDWLDGAGPGLDRWRPMPAMTEILVAMGDGDPQELRFNFRIK